MAVKIEKETRAVNWCLSNTCCHCEPVRLSGVAIPRPMEPGNDYHQKSQEPPFFGCLSVHFPSNGGIATPLKRTGSQ